MINGQRHLKLLGTMEKNFPSNAYIFQSIKSNVTKNFITSSSISLVEDPMVRITKNIFLKISMNVAIEVVLSCFS